jgi:hypothetical protein
MEQLATRKRDGEFVMPCLSALFGRDDTLTGLQADYPAYAITYENLGQRGFCYVVRQRAIPDKHGESWLPAGVYAIITPDPGEVRKVLGPALTELAS